MLFGEGSERKKLEQQMRGEHRLPPGQSLTLKWPVLHEGSVPRADLRTWDFRIDGLVEKPVRLTWESSTSCHGQRFSVTFIA
jgi:DMSO/TMAO reductase YedYZ molybdopterin-dependent catalytic subunit